MKKALRKAAAFWLVRKVNESKKGSIKFLKVEDAEAGETYAVVNPDGGEATVTFDNGQMLVGPFSSPEAAQAELGPDIQIVTGDADGGAVTPIEDGDPVLATEGSKMKPNLLRMRKQVAESIRKQVKIDILRESEALDIDTNVKNDDGSTENAAGALDGNGGQIASFINDRDTGPNGLNVDSDSDPAADSSDDNLIEAREGQLVNVIDRKSGKKVDTGLIESTAGGKIKIGEELYEAKGYQFKVLVS